MASGPPRTHKWKQFLARTTAATGLSESTLLDRLHGAGSTSARVNPLHPDGVEAITAQVLDVVPELEALVGDPTAFLGSNDANVFELIPLAEEGKVYLQNASSLLPVLALAPAPNERILDVAAAPGGKAFNIAGKTGNTGELWLNDAIRPRLYNMAALAETYHVRHHSLTEHKAQYLDKFLPAEYFDRILVDAQCTGEGRFDLRRRNALQHWSEDRIRSYTHAQTKMLSAAYKLLRPGGTLVYSTCTIAPEENELPVHKMLKRHDDLDVAELPYRPPPGQPGLTKWQGERFDPRVERTMRIAPDPRFEAFYVAALIKR